MISTGREWLHRVETGHPRTSAEDQFHEQAQFPCSADLN
jgi:hypothetical protein